MVVFFFSQCLFVVNDDLFILTHVPVFEKKKLMYLFSLNIFYTVGIEYSSKFQNRKQVVLVTTML